MPQALLSWWAVGGAIALTLAIAFAWLSWGPGAMQRRKRGRQEAWLNAHAEYIHSQESQARPMLKSGANVDREALEREVKRWD